MNERVKYVKIQWIEFENIKTDLKIERVNFNKDVTLLVGLSGVGKTQILNAIEYSLNLALDKDKDVQLRPYRVGMGLLIDGDIYEWFYQINKSDESELIINEESKYEFTYEKLIKNGEIVFERTNSDIKVCGYDKVPQPKKNESLILQYSDDKNFEKLIMGIRKLYSVEIELAVRGGIRSESFSRLKSKVVDTFNESKELIDFKIFSHLPVKELFMEIEDLNVEEDAEREIYLVTIPVYGKKLFQQDISNGMLKTIYYIVELFTMSEDSLVLIDEFENGLGVNCIDLLSELMLSERNDLQFIITSHHPKIINAIDKDKWRIIDRLDSKKQQ